MTRLERKHGGAAFHDPEQDIAYWYWGSRPPPPTSRRATVDNAPAVDVHAITFEDDGRIAIWELPVEPAAFWVSRALRPAPIQYFAGGESEDEPYATTARSLELRTGAEAALPPLPVELLSPAVGAVGDEVWVAGGFTSEGPSLDVYELRAGRWQRSESRLPGPGIGGYFTVNGRYVYWLDAENANVSSRHFVLDRQRGSWSQLPQVPGEGHVFVELDDRIYAFSGAYNPSGVVHVLAPDHSGWSPVGTQPHTCGYNAGALFPRRGKILVAGVSLDIATRQDIGSVRFCWFDPADGQFQPAES